MAKRQDRYDRERFDREENRAISRLANRSFLLTANIIYALFNLFFSNYFTTSIINIKSEYLSKYGIIEQFTSSDAQRSWINCWSLFNAINFTALTNISIWGFIYVIGVLLQSWITWRLWYRYKDRNINQLGEARWATPSEMLERAKLIPDREIPFKGPGGLVISHFKRGDLPLKYRKKIGAAAGGYLIEEKSRSVTIIGTTGSTKDQLEVLPSLEVISRASDKSSLVISDPKAEDAGKSVDMLRKRGYDTYILNLSDPLNSMSYNPLYFAIECVKRHQYDEAQAKINSLTFQLYNDPKAKDAHWWKGAQAVVNAMCLAVLDYCEENNNYDRATMPNIATMLSELAVFDSAGNNGLTEYFDDLVEKNKASYSKLRDLAILAFTQSRFAPPSEGGSIKSTAMDQLNIYQQEKIAKMSSKNSVDLRDLGFPRRLEMTFGSQYQFSKIEVTVSRDDRFTNSIEHFSVDLDQIGYFTYALKNTLPQTSFLRVSVQDNSGEKSSYVYQLNKEFVRNANGQIMLDKFDHSKKIKKQLLTKLIYSSNNFKPELHIAYKERPTAIFVVMPSYDSSYNQICSTFIADTYTANAELTVKNSITGELVTKLDYYLNEFGNIPRIAGMATKITVSRSMNIRFNLFIQDNNQMVNLYGEESKTILSNTSTLFLLSNDQQTVKDFSDSLGQKTINITTLNGYDLNLRGNAQNNLQGSELISATDLSKLKEGESIYIATTNRRDNSGNSIFALPFYNRKYFKLPMAYQLLGDIMKKTEILSRQQTNVLHRSVSINENSIRREDFEVFAKSYSVPPSNKSIDVSLDFGNQVSTAHSINSDNAQSQLKNDSVQSLFQSELVSEKVALISLNGIYNLYANDLTERARNQIKYLISQKKPFDLKQCDLSDEDLTFFKDVQGVSLNEPITE